MSTKNKISFLVSFITVLTCFSCLAQDNMDVMNEPNIIINKKGFHVGLLTGAYRASNYTASTYDGYGFDREGRKNDFANSFMYRKIIFEYGGGNGQPDRIAELLKVNHNDWSFTEGDMPANLRYNISVLLGLHMKYCTNWKDAIILNVNASRLTVTGDFTITLTSPQINPQAPGYINYRTYPIKGEEQRLNFQFGFQHIFGDTSGINFFIEGGPSLAMTKFNRNEIAIENFVIDITTAYDVITNTYYLPRNLTGVGLGVFAGMGLNISGPRIALQLLYAPSYDRINIGESPKNTFQHGLGLRVYYRMGK